MIKLLILTVQLTIIYCHHYPFEASHYIDSKTSDDKASINYRLDESTIPIHYDIEITAHLDDDNGFKAAQFTFDSTTRIVILPTTAECNTLRLNIKQLDIKNVRLFQDEPNQTVPVNIQITYTFENTTEIIQLVFSEALTIDDTYILEFTYSGFMDTDMYGFYRSSYVENGKIEWLATTHMEPTHARRVFPSFDEPSYKATFSLILNIPTDYNAISNTKTELFREPYEHDYVTYKFKKTPKMSSYLLAFVVSKFVKRTDTGTDDDIYKMAIWSRPEQHHRTAYALEKGLQIQHELNEYLGIQYDSINGIEKMDMIALPDFSSGAMENWGLITYRESLLLYDEDLTTDLIKKNVAGVNAHEQAHQWFGNLVTCDWWGNTWLNEAFANYFEYFITALVEETWELEKQFVVDNIHRAFVFDSQDGTHPLSHVVQTPAESKAMFNLISYQKGGAILRMIELYIGKENFKIALHNYLNEFALSNGKPENLLQIFQDTQEKNVIDIFMPWITQPGCPMITVDMDYTNNRASITQRRYHLKNKTDSLKWPIPLTYTTNSFENIEPSHVLSPSVSNFVLEIEAPKWIIFNVQQSGYYRVQYDETTWNLITAALNSESYGGIHELNRAQIVDDVLNFGRSNDMDYNRVFHILEYLAAETHFLPWNAAFTGFAFLSSRMDTISLMLFRDFVSRLIEPIFEKLQFTENPDDSQLDRYLRGKVIDWACKSGHANCLDMSRNLFDSYKNDNATLINGRIPVNIRGPVLCSVIRSSNIDVYHFIWNKYLSEDAASEQILLLTALGCANQPDVLFEHLNNIFSNKVRRQDQKTTFQSTYTQTEENIQTVLDYVLEHHAYILATVEEKSELISLIAGLSDRFTKQSQIEQLQNFLIENADEYSAYQNDVERIIASVVENMEWNQQYISVIHDYLNNSTPRKYANTIMLVLIIFVVQLFI